MKIPGVAYLIIGIVVTFFSYFINSQNNNQKLAIFFFLGLIMIIVGIAKIAMGGFKPAEAPKHQHGMHQSFCPFCASQINPVTTYCHVCGSRVK